MYLLRHPKRNQLGMDHFLSFVQTCFSPRPFPRLMASRQFHRTPQSSAQNRFLQILSHKTMAATYGQVTGSPCSRPCNIQDIQVLPPFEDCMASTEVFLEGILVPGSTATFVASLPGGLNRSWARLIGCFSKLGSVAKKTGSSNPAAFPSSWEEQCQTQRVRPTPKPLDVIRLGEEQFSVKPKVWEDSFESIHSRVVPIPSLFGNIRLLNAFDCFKSCASRPPLDFMLVSGVVSLNESHWLFIGKSH